MSPATFFITNQFVDAVRWKIAWCYGFQCTSLESSIKYQYWIFDYQCRSGFMFMPWSSILKDQMSSITTWCLHFIK